MSTGEALLFLSAVFALGLFYCFMSDQNQKKMWKPGQIVTLKPDGIHNKKFRITKCKVDKGVCHECREANMDIRKHNTDYSCPLCLICSCKIPLLCYPKPID